MLLEFARVHTGDVFNLSKTGGWALELQGLYFVTALAVALLGAGRYSLDAVIGHRLPRPLAPAAV
jgi:putative oxidoreductase